MRYVRVRMNANALADPYEMRCLRLSMNASGLAAPYPGLPQGRTYREIPERAREGEAHRPGHAKPVPQLFQRHAKLLPVHPNVRAPRACEAPVVAPQRAVSVRVSVSICVHWRWRWR